MSKDLAGWRYPRREAGPRFHVTGGAGRHNFQEKRVNTKIKPGKPALVPHTESWVNCKPAVAAMISLNVVQVSPGPTVRDFQPMSES